MLLAQSLQPFLMDEANEPAVRQAVFRYFGTFSATLLTMFEVLMANWSPPCRILVDNVSELYSFGFIIYRCLVGFAVLNVVSGLHLTKSKITMRFFQHFKITRKYQKAPYLYIYTCIHTCMHTYLHPCKHTCIDTYWLHTYISTNLHTYKPTDLQTYIPTYLQTYIPTYLRTYHYTYSYLTLTFSWWWRAPCVGTTGYEEDLGTNHCVTVVPISAVQKKERRKNIKKKKRRTKQKRREYVDSDV
eukprot:Skav202214  [mRNA]  locus=scaffold5327:117857:118588:- [translate_table: standard]